MNASSLLEHFDALCELSAAERDARLSQLQGENPALAAMVRDMLAADARTSGLLDQTLPEPTVIVVDRAGERVGPFLLGERLGRGGMGEVYRAERVDAQYQQIVAIKLLRRGLDSADILQRFVQERRILARLEHPAIARLIDGGMNADGLPWIAMELVSGDPITHYALRGALGLSARIRLLMTVCEAVDYAHRRLVVHRDLKPSNVLVDADGLPRLLDFGIAKLLDDDSEQPHTGTGMRIMSPAYAAPEQLRGAAITVATDVYALGLLLYELLTGALPQQRGSASLAVLERALSADPEAPSAAARRLSQIPTPVATSISARSLEGDLDTIVLKALATHPERRYPSAAALAQDLGRYLDGRPIAARPDTLGYRVSKFISRHRGGVLAASFSLLALVSALGITIWQARIAQDQAIRADAEAVRANEEATRAEEQALAAQELSERSKRVKDFLISVFLQEDQLRRDSRGPLTMAEAFDDTLLRIDSELVDDPGLQADLLDDFGEIVTARGDLELAQTLFERALVKAEEGYGENDPAIAETLTNLGVLAGYRGRASDAKPHLLRAMRILEAQPSVDPIALASLLMSIGVVERNEGNLALGLARMERALALFGGPKGTHPGRLAAMNNVATFLIEADRGGEAEPYIREVIAQTIAAQGPDATPLIHAYATLGQILELGSDQVSAELLELGERRMHMANAAFPADHPWKAAALSDSGWYLARNGDPLEGEQRLREGIAMFERLGYKSMTLIAAWRRLSLSQQDRQDRESALASIDAGRALCAEPESARSLICVTIRANRAQLLATTEPGLALTEAQASLRELEARFASHLDERAQALRARSAALRALGQIEESASDDDMARQLLESALESAR